MKPGFDNSIYRDAANAYHGFVKQYDLDPFLNRLSQVFNGEARFSLLELGAGTGVFTVPLSFIADSIDAVEYSDNQITILKEELDKNDIQNVNVISGDANKPKLLCLGQDYDSILFTFSLDNISNASVYNGLDVTRMQSLIESYKPIIKPQGKVIIIGAMPEDTIAADRKTKYEQYRSEQFSVLSKYPDCAIDIFDYAARFGSHAEALGALSEIVPEEKAQEMLQQNSSEVALKAYIASFSFELS